MGRHDEGLDEASDEDEPENDTSAGRRRRAADQFNEAGQGQTRVVSSSSAQVSSPAQGRRLRSRRRGGAPAAGGASSTAAYSAPSLPDGLDEESYSDEEPRKSGKGPRRRRSSRAGAASGSGASQSAGSARGKAKSKGKGKGGAAGSEDDEDEDEDSDGVHFEDLDEEAIVGGRATGSRGSAVQDASDSQAFVRRAKGLARTLRRAYREHVEEAAGGEGGEGGERPQVPVEEQVRGAMRAPVLRKVSPTGAPGCEHRGLTVPDSTWRALYRY